MLLGLVLSWRKAANGNELHPVKRLAKISRVKLHTLNKCSCVNVRLVVEQVAGLLHAYWSPAASSCIVHVLPHPASFIFRT
jgi:hypothetical protein